MFGLLVMEWTEEKKNFATKTTLSFAKTPDVQLNTKEYCQYTPTANGLNLGVEGLSPNLLVLQSHFRRIAGFCICHSKGDLNGKDAYNL